MMGEWRMLKLVVVLALADSAEEQRPFYLLFILHCWAMRKSQSTEKRLDPERH